MTTPERFRRRQRIEGTILLVLGVFTILIAFYFNNEDARQRDCLTRNIHELSDAVQQRGDLAARDSRTTTRVVLDVARATRQEQVRRSLDRYIAAQARIQQARRENPLPPFPKGACQ
jgi:hypothetical protein